MFALAKVSAYVAGFPCTPYSALGERRYLEDSNSKQRLVVWSASSAAVQKNLGLKLSWVKNDR